MSAADLIALGIDAQKARFALQEFAGDVEAASDWCFEEGTDWTPASLLGTQPPPRAPSPPTPPSFSSSTSSSRGPTGHGKPPPHRALHVGTRVKIVLKEDQPTGRTVEGSIKDVLTKGDHPRGVKVRLADGRVGRVAGLL